MTNKTNFIFRPSAHIAFLLLCLYSIFVSAQSAWTLDSCINYAEEHNLSVQLKQLSADSRKLSLNSAKEQFIPSLDAGMGQQWSFGRNVSPQDNTYQNFTTSNSALSVSAGITLFAGFRLVNQVAAAKYEMKAALDDLNAQRIEVRQLVLTAYLQILYQREMLTVNDEQVKLSKEQLNYTQIRYNIGSVSEMQIYEIQSTLAQDELTFVQTENDLRLARITMAQLLNVDDIETFDVAEMEDSVGSVLLPSPEMIYENAETVYPLITAEQNRLKACEKNVKAAKGGYSPLLSVTAGYGNNYYMMDGKASAPFNEQWNTNGNSYVSLTLTVPILSHIQTANKVRSAINARDMQQVELENKKQDVRKKIQQAYYNAITAKKTYESSLMAEMAARKAYNGTSSKFKNGKATTFELDKAKVALSQSASRRIQAKYEYMFCIRLLELYYGL